MATSDCQYIPKGDRRRLGGWLGKRDARAQTMLHSVSNRLRGLILAMRGKEPRAGGRGSLIKGVPSGIDFETLSELCVEFFDKPLRTVSHTHLSGWKTDGAYRLLLRTSDGKERRLVFKDARYDIDLIPALDGLPLQPGPPEYHLYRQANSALVGYLPAVLLAEEILPGRHYQYVLEDLAEDYRRPDRNADRLSIATAIPELHEALSLELPNGACDGCLRYDRKFSLALQEYAIGNLERYDRMSFCSRRSQPCNPRTHPNRNP